MKEPKDFIDFEQFPERLDQVWAVRKEAASKDIAEARTLAQLLHDIPCTTKTDAGDEILSTTSLYGGTYNLFHYTLPKLGITVRFVDADGRLRGVVTFEQVTRALRARLAPS